MKIRTPSRIAAAFGIAGLVALGVAIAAPHGHRDGHGRFVFEQADANGDGQVTLAEADAAKAERMAGMDADSDGYITFEEARAHRQALREERARARFARLDANADGKVSVAEIEARADEHAMKMFERLDRNADGAIAREELPQRMRGQRSDAERR
jgi:Ca2+-binding EF-hand superfamily protein